MRSTLAPLVAATSLALAGCVSVGQGGGSAEERDYWKDWFGPNAELEEGDDLEARLAHMNRYEALDEMLAAAVARDAGLEPDELWMLHPDFAYFRLTLNQATLNGEAASEICTSERASNDEFAAQQHAATMSTCAAMFRIPCRNIFGGKCREYRQRAYNLCQDIADCQRDCCLESCDATSCATWAANGKAGGKCANCAPGAVPE